MKISLHLNEKNKKLTITPGRIITGTDIRLNFYNNKTNTN